MARIVHWGKYYPPDMGGIESVTASLARGAAEAGHHVSVVCFDRRNVPFEDRDGAVRVLRAPIEIYKASQPLGWRYLRTLLSEARRADIVHLHAPNMLAALATLALPRRVQLLVHWHSDVVGKGHLHTLLKPTESAMLRRADCIMCTSQPYADASEALRRYQSKLVIAPIGVPGAGDNRHDGSNIPPSIDQFIAGRHLIIAVGRLVPYKGFSVLVRAAGLLAPNCAVVIVGDGPLREALQREIKNAAVQDRVMLAGRLGAEALDALLRRAKAFCLPSVERAEAFGVAIVEAMSYGLPVVATQIKGSGVPWVNQQGESGLNVPAGDANALADACNQILECKPLRDRLSAGSRARYEAEFNESRFVERTNAVYRRLAQAHDTAA
jgi:glycosyltransferase involved in cell wall biosynthesis